VVWRTSVLPPALAPAQLAVAVAPLMIDGKEAWALLRGGVFVEVLSKRHVTPLPDGLRHPARKKIPVD